MAFMTLKKIVFEEYKSISYFFLFFYFFFVYSLPSLIYEMSHNTLLGLSTKAQSNIFRGEMWLYGIDSFFSHVLIEFLLAVSICCSFCNRI